MRELGLIPPLLPEIATFGTWPYAELALGHLPATASFPLAFAAVLHRVGRDAAAIVAERLKLSNVESERLCWLVENQNVLVDAATLRASKLKPILVHPGISELLALHRAIALAHARGAEDVEFCERMLRDTPPDVLNPAPLVTGEDLIAIGLKPGPVFKRLLDAVREAQLDGQVTTKEQALSLVQRLLSEWGASPGTPPA